MQNEISNFKIKHEDFSIFDSQSILASKKALSPEKLIYSTPFQLNSNHESNKIKDLEAILDYKLSQRFIGYNENLIILQKSLESHHKKVCDLESRQTFFETEINDKFQEKFGEKISPGLSYRLRSFLDDHDSIKIYKEDVDNDSYLYLSIAFSIVTIPLFLGYIYVIFCKKAIIFIKRLKFLVMLLISPLTLIPGIATPLIQFFSAFLLYRDAESQYSSIDMQSFVTLKFLMIVIFMFMVAREVSQAINSFFFCFFQAKRKKQFFFAGCFLPSLIQIFISFFIFYVTFLLIGSSNDPIDLIQNFAGIYILLEIDNIMMAFIRLTKLSVLLMIINQNLHQMREELGWKEIFSKELIKKILVENSLIIDYENQHIYFKKAFLLLRMIVIFGLIIFLIFIWMSQFDSITVEKIHII